MTYLYKAQISQELEKKFSSATINLSSVTKVLPIFDESIYENILNTPSIQKTDEYLEELFLIQKLQDVESVLFSAYRLRELIGEEIEATPRFEASKSYYEKDGKNLLEINGWAVAARHLIAHGQVSNQNPLRALNDYFGMPETEAYEFNRKNQQHINLVKLSAKEFLEVLTKYLKGELF